MTTIITQEQVYRCLRTVMDPELHIDIVSLGLIYNVTIHAREVTVEMTLTTPGCPLAPVIDRMVKEALEPLAISHLTLELVWDPPWTKELMSEEARLQLGII